MATVRIPSSLHAQITRSAISPRLAIRIFLNIEIQLSAFSCQLSALSYQFFLGVGDRKRLCRRNTKGAARAPQQEIQNSLLRPDHEQLLPIFNRLPVDRQLLDDLPGK